MALAVRNPRVEFKGGTGPRYHRGQTEFSRKVNQAGVALTGFLWDYDSSDNQINFAAEATTRITCWRDKVVEWEVELDYKDNGDDSYTCAVDVTVFADLADAPSSPSASEPSTMTAAEVLRAHSPASSAAGPDVRRVRLREGDS